MRDLDTITKLAGDFLSGSPLNTVPELGNMRIYDEPLIGMASAEDPLFARLKDPQAVGPHHLLPTEWLPGARTVISYFLPFTSRVREANYLPDLPATEWLYARIEGEMCNNALRSFLMVKAVRTGANAVAPSLDPRYHVPDKKSNWSERHVAFIAGLGTFSLNKSLITAQGSAGRFGSIIIDREYPPTPRSYEGLYEYCNECGACIPRCPVQAISRAGKEHGPCSDYLDKMKEIYEPRYGCGKCQTHVPCEYAIP